jgi:hypothetical protein
MMKKIQSTSSTPKLLGVYRFGQPTVPQRVQTI